MHVSILIAAWISFGQLSFDLSAVAAALDRTLEPLPNRNLQMSWIELDKTNLQNQVTGIDPDKRVYKHVWKNGERYFEWNYPSGEMHVDCFTSKHRFEVTKDKKAWERFQIHSAENEQGRVRDFLTLSYAGLFFLSYSTLTEMLQKPAIQAVWLPLGQTRGVFWGKWSHHNDPAQTIFPMRTIIEFSAIVRFSESGQRAFLQRSDVLTISSAFVMREVTTSNAQFESESFRCNHIELKRTQFPDCRTEDDVRNCKTAFTVRSRIDHSSDVDVKDEQLTPAYYGISDTTIRNRIHQADTEAKAMARLRPPTPHATPRSNSSNEQYDLAIAIGIPVVLLAALLIVIRKT